MTTGSLFQSNGSSDRRCICDATWKRCPQGARRWRGNPGLVDPFDQWFSENMPSGREGTTSFNLDKIIRGYKPGTDPIGGLIGLELKTHGKTIMGNYAEQLGIKGINDHRMMLMLVLEMSGNTPGGLRHFPVPCACCGLPDQPVVSESMRLRLVTLEDGIQDLGLVTEADLVENFRGEAVYQRWVRFTEKEQR